MSVEVGQILDGKYRITRLIGQGGMGAVYEGVHQLIDRKVAIKVLLPHQDESSSERFQQEARAAGRIGNDHILEILDLGALSDGAKYMVCEYLDGQPFSDLIESRGRLQPEQVVPLVLQLLSGLGAAHDAGVIHRDLKPDNIFVLKQKAGKRDFIKIIDFGISKFSQLDGGDGLSMTKTGMMVGTPNYMSPEQARGLGKIDARADLYAVGVILYETVSGQLPYSADTFNDLLFKVVLEDPTPLEDIVHDLPSDFIAIIKKAMARDPDNRFSTAQEFSSALEAWSVAHGVALGSTGATSLVTPRLSQASSRPEEASIATSPTMRTMVGQAPHSALIQGTLSNSNSSQVEASADQSLSRSAPTPGAFGNTRPHTIPMSSPWWTRRPLQLGVLAALVCSLLVTLVIIFTSDELEVESPVAAESTETVDSPKKQEPSAAAQAIPEDPTELGMKGKATETESNANLNADEELNKPSSVKHKPPAPVQVAAPSPSPRPSPSHVAPSPVAAPHVAAPRVAPPAPPATPAPEPKRRVDFGY